MWSRAPLEGGSHGTFSITNEKKRPRNILKRYSFFFVLLLLQITVRFPWKGRQDRFMSCYSTFTSKTLLNKGWWAVFDLLTPDKDSVFTQESANIFDIRTVAAILSSSLLPWSGSRLVSLSDYRPISAGLHSLFGENCFIITHTQTIEQSASVSPLNNLNWLCHVLLKTQSFFVRRQRAINTLYKDLTW